MEVMRVVEEKMDLVHRAQHLPAQDLEMKNGRHRPISNRL